MSRTSLKIIFVMSGVSSINIIIIIVDSVNLLYIILIKLILFSTVCKACTHQRLGSQVSRKTHGRKTPLKEIREKLLKTHSKYRRATRDTNINSMSKECLQAELEKVNELNGIDIDNIDAMRQKLQNLERTRHLMVWLDNSTVANSGYLVCLITCLYDPAVFYTDDIVTQD